MDHCCPCFTNCSNKELVVVDVVLDCSNPVQSAGVSTTEAQRRRFNNSQLLAEHRRTVW